MIEKGVDLEISHHFVAHLKPQQSSLHYGISPNSHIYGKLSDFWKDRNKEYKKAEKEVQGLISFFEGKRRSLALRQLLQKNIYSKKWKFIKKSLKSRQFSGGYWKKFEKYYGISGDPTSFHNIPKPTWGLHKFQDELLFFTLIQLMGPENGKTRQELCSHILSTGYSSRWWEKFDLQNENDKFGLNVWKLLQIGEALKLGCPDWQSQWEKSPTKADLAYSQLFSIFLDVEKSLNIPWVESSERAWLNSFLEIYTKKD
jgi:hypothetical protein